MTRETAVDDTIVTLLDLRLGSTVEVDISDDADPGLDHGINGFSGQVTGIDNPANDHGEHHFANVTTDDLPDKYAHACLTLVRSVEDDGRRVIADAISYDNQGSSSRTEIGPVDSLNVTEKTGVDDNEEGSL